MGRMCVSMFCQGMGKWTKVIETFRGGVGLMGGMHVICRARALGCLISIRRSFRCGWT